MSQWWVMIQDVDGALRREGLDEFPGVNPFDDEEGNTIAKRDMDYTRRAGVDWDASVRDYVAKVPATDVTPSVNTALTKGAFIDRVGSTVLGTAFVMRETSPDPVVRGKIELFRFLLDNRATVRVDSPDTIAGVGLLRSLGIISDADVARILALPTDAEAA